MPLFDPDFLFVLIAIAAGAWLIGNRLRERQGQTLPDTAPPALAQLRAENEALRERLISWQGHPRVLLGLEGVLKVLMVSSML